MVPIMMSGPEVPVFLVTANAAAASSSDASSASGMAIVLRMGARVPGRAQAMPLLIRLRTFVEARDLFVAGVAGRVGGIPVDRRVQALLDAPRRGPAEAVGGLGAVQAQELGFA